MISTIQLLWFCEDSGNNAIQRQREMGGGLEFEEIELETCGEDAHEWRESKVRYGDIEANLERVVIL